jgi:hypothetical protein
MVEVMTPPRIVTRWDTVQVLDTVHITRTIRETVFDTTILERVLTSAPETLRVLPPEIRGLTFISVPDTAGDSTVARGFELAAHDSLFERRSWEAHWWTPGPLRVLALDTFPPRVSFGVFPQPARECGFLCKVSHYLVGAALGAAVWEIAR